MKKLKPIPKFESTDEWAAFWMNHDTTEYTNPSDWKQTIFPNLQPSSKTISLRIPEPMLDAVKIQANKKGVPYQSLMKVYLAKQIAAEG